MTDDERAVFMKAVFAMNDELKRKEPDWTWLAKCADLMGILSKPRTKPLDPTPPTRYGNG